LDKALSVGYNYLYFNRVAHMNFKKGECSLSW